jgi:hypothetical protein
VEGITQPAAELRDCPNIVWPPSRERAPVLEFGYIGIKVVTFHLALKQFLVRVCFLCSVRERRPKFPLEGFPQLLVRVCERPGTLLQPIYFVQDSLRPIVYMRPAYETHCESHTFNWDPHGAICSV